MSKGIELTGHEYAQAEKELLACGIGLFNTELNAWFDKYELEDYPGIVGHYKPVRRIFKKVKENE